MPGLRIQAPLGPYPKVWLEDALLWSQLAVQFTALEHGPGSVATFSLVLSRE